MREIGCGISSASASTRKKREKLVQIIRRNNLFRIQHSNQNPLLSRIRICIRQNTKNNNIISATFTRSIHKIIPITIDNNFGFFFVFSSHAHWPYHGRRLRMPDLVVVLVALAAVNSE